MSPSTQSLFDENDLPREPSDRALVIRPSATRPLTKQERAYNRALTRVQALRVRLEDEKRRLDRALVFHAQEIRPRVERAVELRCQLVGAIAPFLDDRRLKPGDRRVLRAILVEQLDYILAHDEKPSPDMQALFERLHGITYAQAVKEDIDEVRSGMAAMFDELGIDVDVPDLGAEMSEEEMAAAAAQLVDRLSSAERARSVDQQNRRKTKRDLREEERARQLAQMRKDSIGAVYKRLVKALHPDLERDDAERQKKSGLMQEVTAAYGRGDLHTLLRLELEWINEAGGVAGGLSDEKLRAYTELLKEQVAQLEAECQDLCFHPRYAVLIGEDPFGVPRVIDGPRDVARLDFVIEQVRAGIGHMASDQSLQEVRRAINEYRRIQKQRRTPARW
jgi:hypothetical protein